MCGIAGILSSKRSREEVEAIVRSMSKTLVHRGPDALETWTNDDDGIGFGHNRLAINDLSPLGLQPMTSQCGRYTICFNGEIYNFKELRKSLVSQGVRFKGQSDTEVLLEYISARGVKRALNASRGMFAFGLWDSKEKNLILARDRLGEKPLYYGSIGGDLVFASELKAAYRHPDFKFDIDQVALSSYVKYSYVPTPQCILAGFRKLPAGCFVTGQTADEMLNATLCRYWTPKQSLVENATTSGLEELLLQTISDEMVSDVPIGCFLSGGVDSSLISALMQSISNSPIDTFTIGFNEKKYDESQHARAVASHLGTNHNEWFINESDVIDLIPSLPHMYDEPFADSSQLPTSLLSKMTRKSVTVCLSGDGGDEIFCGYDRYIWTDKVNRYLSRIPRPLRSLYQRLFSLRTIRQWNLLYEKVKPLSPVKVNNLGTKLDILNSYCSKQGAEELYDSFLSHWQLPQEIVVGAENNSIVTDSFSSSLSLIENLMLHDSMNYLTDDIMVKVDRASMAASLESRAPLLDHKVFEYAWSMPIGSKYSNGVTKKPLRDILYKYVPKEIIDRPKMGFGVPLESWFKNELKDWCEESLSEQALGSHGLFHPKPIRKVWTDHRDKNIDMPYHLWNILSFQAWYRYWSEVAAR